MMISSGSQTEGSDLELRQPVHPTTYTVVCTVKTSARLWARLSRVMKQVEVSNFLDRPRLQEGSP